MDCIRLSAFSCNDREEYRSNWSPHRRSCQYKFLEATALDYTMRDGDNKNLPSTTCWTAGEPRGKINWLEAVRARGTGSARINSLAWDTIATDDTKKFRRQECTDANQGSLSRADVCPSNSSSPSIRGTISAGAP